MPKYRSPEHVKPYGQIAIVPDFGLEDQGSILGGLRCWAVPRQIKASLHQDEDMVG